MALARSAYITEGCESLAFTESTGSYSVDNPTGYGVLNGVSEPADFDTFVLQIWGPLQDPATDTPLFTHDLLSDLPAVNGDDEYVWTFTEEDLGFTLTSGVYYATSVGTYQGETYSVALYPILKKELGVLICAKMKDHDPACPCKAGCQSPAELYANHLLLQEGDTCSVEQAKNIIRWLRTQLQRCC